MNIGLLNCVLFIEKNKVIVDDNGNHKNTWEQVFYCHATVGGESGNEENVAGNTEEEETLTFTVRWSSETKDLTTTGYRVIFGESIYNIIAIDHMNYKKKAIKLKCQIVRR